MRRWSPRKKAAPGSRCSGYFARPDRRAACRARAGSHARQPVTADDAVVAVLSALDSAAIPYMIVGSLASNFHGIPRSTRDADFVVDLGPSSLDRLSAALPSEMRLGAQSAFEA